MGLLFVSIHLMLLFISRWNWRKNWKIFVSIHLMLLFILRREYKKRGAERFNTSHVTLYLNEVQNADNLRAFQYISCYSLSVQADVTQWYSECFNTSHVTLYHPSAKSSSQPLKRFNTSHVTLYRARTKQVIQDYFSFNTSHVTLYLCSACCNPLHWRVSIHLMLLFIRTAIDRATADTTFQYISCYSLSETGRWMQRFEESFNTSHVTLYHGWKPIHATVLYKFQYISCYSLSLYPPEKSWSERVSIHLMLLFIDGLTVWDLRVMVCFNTSHVTLYRVVPWVISESRPSFNTSHVTLYPTR